MDLQQLVKGGVPTIISEEYSSSLSGQMFRQFTVGWAIQNSPHNMLVVGYFLNPQNRLLIVRWLGWYSLTCCVHADCRKMLLIGTLYCHWLHVKMDSTHSEVIHCFVKACVEALWFVSQSAPSSIPIFYPFHFQGFNVFICKRHVFLCHEILYLLSTDCWPRDNE